MNLADIDLKILQTNSFTDDIKEGSFSISLVSEI